MKTHIILTFYIIMAAGIATAQDNEKFSEIEIKTSARCNMCKERIETNLAFEKGVKEVKLDLEKNIVTIKYRKDKTDPDKLRKALSLLGYDADEIPADQKAHDNLPECCRKEADPH